MTTTISIKNETLSGQVNYQTQLTLQQEVVSAAELIRESVYQEVKQYNESMPEYFRSLVQPLESEPFPAGYRCKKRIPIDPEKQFYLTLDAFQKNGFFMIVNQQQITQLDALIPVYDQLEVSFVKLTPLVGG